MTARRLPPSDWCHLEGRQGLPCSPQSAAPTGERCCGVDRGGEVRCQAIDGIWAFLRGIQRSPRGAAPTGGRCCGVDRAGVGFRCGRWCRLRGAARLAVFAAKRGSYRGKVLRRRPCRGGVSVRAIDGIWAFLRGIQRSPRGAAPTGGRCCGVDRAGRGSGGGIDALHSSRKIGQKKPTCSGGFFISQVHR